MILSSSVPVRRRKASVRALLASIALASLPLEGRATEPPQTVVELFTSQGCSSCPPANDYLAKLSQRPGVIALSFGVTYWDRLGWRDTLARKEFTARQTAYEGPLGESGPFTPQMVVGGRASAVGSEVADVERLIATDRERGPVTTLKLGNGTVTVGAGQAPPGGADVWLVRYDPSRVEVPVRRGENAGRTLAHANVVRELASLGSWSGRQVTLPIPAAGPGLRTAILVQTRHSGPIVAAATD